MKYIIAITIFFSLICFKANAQDNKTTYKDKNGNPIGYSKQQGNKTTNYDKSHNKTGSSKTNGNQTTYYNKQGNPIIKAKKK